MSKLVIFDIDGTLVPGASSEVRFARYLWRQGQLGPRQMAAFAWFAVRYFMRYPKNVMQKNKAYLFGLEVHSVAALAREFVADELMQDLHPPTLLRLRAHQAASETVVLLSGTPEFIAQALGEALQAEASIGAVCDASHGRYSARPPHSHPYGKTKLEAARQLAAQFDLPLSQAVAYGDSIHDAWLFRGVGKGIAVMPDRNLRAAAAGEGWETFS